MTTFVVLVGLAAFAAGIAAFALISFQLGRSSARGELTRVRIEAAHARRRMHDFNRELFTSLTETANRSGRDTEQ